MTHSIQYHRYIDIAGYVNAFHALSGNEVKFSGFMPNNTWECSQLTYIHIYEFVCASFIYLYVVHISLCLTVSMPVSLSRLSAAVGVAFLQTKSGQLGRIWYAAVKWSKFIATQRRVDCTDMDIYIYTIHYTYTTGFWLLRCNTLGSWHLWVHPFAKFLISIAKTKVKSKRKVAKKFTFSFHCACAVNLWPKCPLAQLHTGV